MTVVDEFTCDYCGRTERQVGTQPRTSPMGWWEAPMKGANESVGHACPYCITDHPSIQEDVIRRRDEATQRVLGSAPPTSSAYEPTGDQ